MSKKQNKKGLKNRKRNYSEKQSCFFSKCLQHASVCLHSFTGKLHEHNVMMKRLFSQTKNASTNLCRRFYCLESFIMCRYMCWRGDLRGRRRPRRDVCEPPSLWSGRRATSTRHRRSPKTHMAEITWVWQQGEGVDARVCNNMSLCATHTEKRR